GAVVAGLDRNRTDGSEADGIGNVLPRRTAVGALPNAAAGGPGVVQQGVGVASGYGRRTALGKRGSENSPAHLRDRTFIGGANERRQNGGERRTDDCGAPAAHRAAILLGLARRCRRFSPALADLYCWPRATSPRRSSTCLVISRSRRDRASRRALECRLRDGNPRRPRRCSD